MYLGGNNDVITELFLPRRGLVSDIPAGDGKLVNLFYGVVIPLGGDEDGGYESSHIQSVKLLIYMASKAIPSHPNSSYTVYSTP
jgi:hypothetical protein